MIIFNQEKNTFLLSGKSYSYALLINKVGTLQHLYYGAKLQVSDIDMISAFGNGLAPKREDICHDMCYDDIPHEYGFFARGDFREPSLIAVREDGSAMTRLKYVAHEIFKGAPQWEGLPHARVGDETLAVTLKDDFSDTEVVLYFTVSDNEDVLVRNAVVRNAGKGKIDVKKAFSFCVDLPVGKYNTLRLFGRWGGERMTEYAPLAYGVTRLHSLRGSSSHMTSPFLALLREGCTEEAGECYAVQLCYSGSFALTAEYAEGKLLRLQGGINETNFSWQLNGGEELVTPQAFLCYSNAGVGGMSRAFADFLRDCVINPNFAKVKRPVIINNWEATYLECTNEKLFPIVDEAASLGIDMFVLDDGWFGARNDLESGLGDWVVNEEKIKGGLKGLIDRCKQKGMKFGLWFEPEMISPNSDLYRLHPDYAVERTGNPSCLSRTQYVLDFSRQEVVDCIFEQMKKVLSENDISYVKWDMNRNVTESYSKTLPADRQGEFMHRYILGVYQLHERLLKEFPYLMIEGCASGGGRFDAGILYYCPQIWTSDVTDGFERARIQWGTSTCFPLSAMSCHVSVCPNHQTGRTTPFSTRGAIASLGATGYELDLSKLTEEEKEQVRAQLAQYRKIDSLILEGDLYRLLDPFKTEFFCEMVVSKDKKRAYVVGECTHGKPFLYCEHLQLRGLDPDKTYLVEEMNLRASGSALMGVGIPKPCLRDFESWTWNIVEVE